MDEDAWWDWQVHHEDDLFKSATMWWGGDAQMAKAAEEFSELAAVCARDINRQADQEELLRELVDARIMIEQIARHITDEALKNEVERQLNELADRLHEKPAHD